MTVHAIVALILLALPAVVPTITLVGLRPMTPFLVPLVGSVLAAVAAEFELAFGGSLLTWFVVLAALANAGAVWRLWSSAFRRLVDGTPETDPSDRGPVLRSGPIAHARASWPWSWLTVVAVIAAVAWPLRALRAPIIFDDGYLIWTLHSIFVSGGHHTLQSDLQNRAYGFSHPDYPPLVPASGALAFVSEGRVDIRLAVIVTSLLNACGLGVLACGIAEVASRRRQAVGRLAAIAMAALICLIGFGLAGGFAVGGYADLLWAATATAAMVYGLVLARSPQYLAVAWLCATVASLTKQEGLATALIILVLIAARYLPIQRSMAPSHSSMPAGATVTTPTRSPLRIATSTRMKSMFRAATAIGAALVLGSPGLGWAVLIKLNGIRTTGVNNAHETVGQRLHLTVVGLAHNLHIFPVAAVVALAGILTMRDSRRRLQRRNASVVWIVVIGSLAVITATYVFGSIEIKWWLATSVSRTTIFANLALYTDLAIWLVVALDRDGPTHDLAPPPALIENESPALDSR